jgi:YebC/PmpR family DNA-binding regulatory protein
MSGHSKWETIKRKKGATDAARAKEFTKVARMITVAAQNGGGDPTMNPSLALAIAKGKQINMPNDNIDRAVKKGTGESTGGSRLEEITYEAYGPNNTALIIDCATDNKNRTVGELRPTIEKNGGRFAETGSVSWQFTTTGNILLEFETEQEAGERAKQKWGQNEEKRKINKAAAEDFQLELFDQKGILDVLVDEYGIEIKTEYSELNNIRKFVESKGYKISDAELVKESNTPVVLTEDQIERVEKFIEIIENIDDVQRVWSNVKS